MRVKEGRKGNKGNEMGKEREIGDRKGEEKIQEQKKG